GGGAGGGGGGGDASNPCGPPHCVVHLHDERAAGRVVGVPVHLHHAVGRLLDVKLERVEDQVGAEPHVPAAADVEAGPERDGPGGPRRRVGPVGRHHQVVAGP